MPYVRVDTGSGPVRRFRLGDEAVRIGRGDQADIRILDPQMSRAHCEICCQDDGSWVLRDLGSTNRTWCNDQAVREMPLEDRTTFLVGQTVIQFRVAQPSAAVS